MSGWDQPYRVERVSSGIVVVYITGEIDLATQGRFRRFLVDLVPGDCNVVMDLSGVEFFGAAGLRVLAQFAERMVLAGRHFVIVPDRFVTRLLRAAGMDDSYLTAESVDGASSVLATLTRHDREALGS